MSAKIYVGNLSWNTNDDTLRQVFSQYGSVLDSIVMRDRETGRSRGFGFVTYASQEEATHAINTANNQELDGRQIKVNLANARGSGGGGALGGGFPMQASFGSGGAGGAYPPTFPGGYGGGAPYGGGFTGYPAPPNNPSVFGVFNPQGPGGYGGAPGQFPPNQGGGYGGAY